MWMIDTLRLLRVCKLHCLKTKSMAGLGIVDEVVVASHLMMGSKDMPCQ